eukprot:1389690-Pleurochrysis_carterae.AAC.2
MGEGGWRLRDGQAVGAEKVRTCVAGAVGDAGCAAGVDFVVVGAVGVDIVVDDDDGGAVAAVAVGGAVGGTVVGAAVGAAVGGGAVGGGAVGWSNVRHGFVAPVCAAGALAHVAACSMNPVGAGPEAASLVGVGAAHSLSPVLRIHQETHRLLQASVQIPSHLGAICRQAPNFEMECLRSHFQRALTNQRPSHAAASARVKLESAPSAGHTPRSAPRPGHRASGLATRPPPSQTLSTLCTGSLAAEACENTTKFEKQAPILREAEMWQHAHI